VARLVDRAFQLEIARTNPRPLQSLGPSRYEFGDAEKLPGDGPAAAGGDFSPATIVAAYSAGLFPWPHPGYELLWFSPDPRAIILAGGLHVSRRLSRTLRQGRFHLTLDGAFSDVLAGCARRVEGTWITPAYAPGYRQLFELGWAHSIEVWTADGALAGGLYGLRVGGMFGAESMFHRMTDASKVAMVAMMQWAEEEGISLIDIQQLTPHTAGMGAIEIPRSDYLRRLRQALAG
jgi:leucyl/phenylalanyl-tRNA--protein transferase